MFKRTGTGFHEGTVRFDALTIESDWCIDTVKARKRPADLDMHEGERTETGSHEGTDWFDA